ncbi:VTC1A ATPase, partial [Amia calva]|nr:VTC1A ATPase [Amia calva]
QQVSQIDGELKSQMEAYNRLKGNLQAAERKAVGNLLTRTLTDIVKKDDFVLDSEYLTTLLVVVPRTQDTTWEKTYESLSELVVPRSTKKITEDSDGGLFTVTLFKKVVADFRVKARENKFIVREFSYDEAELEAEKEEITRFTTEQKQQYGPLLRWLKVNFSEVFVAWIHMKGLRVFVESVLRYGLPVNFQAVLLQPNEKKIKQLREVLASHFSYLDGRGGGKLDVGVDIPGMILVNQEYHSYVYFKIDADVANGI